MPDIRTETMTVNMGPQHPSTHGVLRLVLELDGETVLSAAPTIGYLHTGIEKTAEQKKWQQVIPLVERMDYLSAQSNSMAFCLSVERLLGIDVLPRGFHEAVTAFLDRFVPKLDEYEDLLTSNEIYRERTQGVGRISREDALGYALVGPIARAAGVDYDVRKRFPYIGYDGYEFAVPTRTEGDAYARYLVRVAEMRESVKICRQALARIPAAGPYAVADPRITPPPKDRVYTEMEALIQHFLIYSQGFAVPAGEAYVPVEGPRGEHGFYVVSDGTNRPWRVKSRAPSLLACQALERMIVGGLIADV